MSPGDYERFRQQLEAQFRADIELLSEAYRTKLRAYETVCRARGELDAEPWAPPDVPRSLPEAAAPFAEEETPAAPEAPPPPPGKSRAYEMRNAISGAVTQMPEVFDKHDIGRALGFAPRRATLTRILRELVLDGDLAVDAAGAGKRPTRFRKVSPETPS
jgi:hypothetical protein